ncbi:3 transmembrane domain protein [Sulfolobus ellipsoid virus 1]|uniref:3 transmembrane domain protein n=1 Tax=Sulfolobus ellipsoid virus 1 TaxID=2056194 RepID=A0A2H4RBS7_9VIRU|nr:3 transmembrane domain protein [Sulfolobus ellipsoid virus 1]ATY46508.1 3 transmembrane domain protein [Sulfolobus ellipsoid virus 1]
MSSVFTSCVEGAVTGFAISSMLVSLGIVAVGVPPVAVALGIILGATAFGCAIFTLANQHAIQSTSALTVEALITALVAEQNDINDLMTDLNNFLSYLYNNAQTITKGIQYDILWIVATSINQPLYAVLNYVEKYAQLFTGNLVSAYQKFFQSLVNSIYGLFNTINASYSVIQNVPFTFNGVTVYPTQLEDAGLLVYETQLLGQNIYVPFGFYIKDTLNNIYMYLFSQLPSGNYYLYSSVTNSAYNNSITYNYFVGFLNYKYLIDPLSGLLIGRALNTGSVPSGASGNGMTFDNVQLDYPYSYTGGFIDTNANSIFILIPTTSSGDTVNIYFEYYNNGITFYGFNYENQTVAFSWALNVYNYINFLNNFFNQISNFATQIYNLLQSNGITNPTQAIQYLGLGAINLAFPSCNPSYIYENNIVQQFLNALLSQQKLQLNTNLNLVFPNFIYSSSVTINGQTYQDAYIQLFDPELTLPNTTQYGGWLYLPNNNQVIPIAPNTYIKTSNPKRWSLDIWYPDNQISECQIVPVTEFQSINPNPQNTEGFILNVNNTTVISNTQTFNNAYIVSNTATILYKGTITVTESTPITYVPAQLAYQVFYGNEITDTSQIIQQTPSTSYLVVLLILLLIGVAVGKKINKKRT